MTADAHLAAEFYGSARGAVTARLLRERLLAMWPAAPGESLLGIGYTMPYLRLWRDHATRCIALTPAQMGAARWPPGLPNLSCAAEEDGLPFADLSFDRILLVHGLEMAENARRLLREVGGIDLVELPQAESCCGFGGTFAVKNPDTSAAMLTDKMHNVLSTRAEVCSASDSSSSGSVSDHLSRRSSSSLR